jgi:hypothetical protein
VWFIISGIWYWLDLAAADVSSESVLNRKFPVGRNSFRAALPFVTGYQQGSEKPNANRIGWRQEVMGGNSTHSAAVFLFHAEKIYARCVTITVEISSNWQSVTGCLLPCITLIKFELRNVNALGFLPCIRAIHPV